MRRKQKPKPTWRPLLLDQPLQPQIHSLAAHLARKHEHQLYLARRDDEGDVSDAKALRDEGKPGAEVGDRVGGVLWFGLGTGGARIKGWRIVVYRELRKDLRSEHG